MRLVVLLLLGFLVGLQVSTQLFASMLSYDQEYLGAALHVDEPLGVALWGPWAILRWSWEFYGQGADDVLVKHLALSLVGPVVGAGVELMLRRAALRQEPERVSHGSSRFMRLDELDALELTIPPEERRKLELGKGKDLRTAAREAASVCVGMHPNGDPMYISGSSHILGYAPTRSGKGIGWIIPTLLTYTGSVVVTDIKGENYEVTASWRSTFSHVIYFNPTYQHTARWNPLDELRLGPTVIRDAMNLGEILGAPERGKENRFWDSGAKNLLTATILFVLYTQKPKTLARVSYLISRAEHTIDAMSECSIASNPSAEEFIHATAQTLIDASDNVRGGWIAGAAIAVDLWRDPLVAHATSASDLQIRDLQYAEHPVSIYLHIPPSDLNRLAPLVRLFFEYCVDKLTEDHAASADAHQLLMLADEFPAFGTMRKIETSIPYTAGFGIRWFFIGQGLEQFENRYGRNHQFNSNSHVTLAYRTNDTENARKLSEMLGDTTGFKEQEGEAGKKGLFRSMSNQSVSHVEFARKLMTPAELNQLDEERQLTIISGHLPIMNRRLKYFQHKRFRPRYKGRAMPFPTSPQSDFPRARASSGTPNRAIQHTIKVSAEDIEDIQTLAPDFNAFDQPDEVMRTLARARQTPEVPPAAPKPSPPAPPREPATAPTPAPRGPGVSLVDEDLPPLPDSSELPELPAPGDLSPTVGADVSEDDPLGEMLDAFDVAPEKAGREEESHGDAALLRTSAMPSMADRMAMIASLHDESAEGDT